MRHRSALVLLGLTIFGDASAESASDRAEQLALSLPRVRAHLATLKAEASQIRNATLRKDALSLLSDRPVFHVIETRRAHENEIVAQLRAAGLLDPSFAGPLFPDHEPMRFVAAPGGPGVSHHVYPGGLVYHTVFNLKMGLDYAKNYRAVYGIELDLDLVRLSAIWHDMAKTVTIEWSEDGQATPEEARIAGTTAHHIWGIAEGLRRGWPVRAVLSVASAHSPPTPGSDEKALIGHLRAASIIAGVPPEAAGLSADGSSLSSLAPIEAFVTHLDDHDYVLSMHSQRRADEKLRALPVWERLEALARRGDIAIYWEMEQGK